jgi:RNA polymerase sigma factor (sigma-70 family)
MRELHLQGSQLTHGHQTGWEMTHLPTVNPLMETPLERLLAQRKRFLAFVQRRVQDAGLAEDILQGAYVRALEHHDDLNPNESAVAWFYRLLRNAVIDNHRRGATKRKFLEEWAHVLELSPGSSAEEQREICACLHDVIEHLKPEYAESLRAIDLGEQRVQEFAERRGISPSNASVRVHRARIALRKQLLRICSTCAEHGCLNCTCKTTASRRAVDQECSASGKDAL